VVWWYCGLTRRSFTSLFQGRSSAKPFFTRFKIQLIIERTYGTQSYWVDLFLCIALSIVPFCRPKTNPWANDASQRMIDDNRSNERTAAADGWPGWSSLPAVDNPQTTKIFFIPLALSQFIGGLGHPYAESVGRNNGNDVKDPTSSAGFPAHCVLR